MGRYGYATDPIFTECGPSPTIAPRGRALIAPLSPTLARPRPRPTPAPRPRAASTAHARRASPPLAGRRQRASSPARRPPVTSPAPARRPPGTILHPAASIRRPPVSSSRSPFSNYSVSAVLDFSLLDFVVHHFPLPILDLVYFCSC